MAARPRLPQAWAVELFVSLRDSVADVPVIGQDGMKLLEPRVCRAPAAQGKDQKVISSPEVEKGKPPAKAAVEDPCMESLGRSFF